MVKSPLNMHRQRCSRIVYDQVSGHPKIVDAKLSIVTGGPVIRSANILRTNERLVDSLPTTNRTLQQVSVPANACYETAFTSAEPETRIIDQDHVDFLRRAASSRRAANVQNANVQRPVFDGFRVPANVKLTRADTSNKENVYRSLDRLRSKSGGYVNLAAFGSADCLDRTTGERSQWWYPDDSMGASWINETTTSAMHHSRSVSSLSSCRTGATGLSPSSFSESGVLSSTLAGQCENYENLREFSHLLHSSTDACNETSPSDGCSGLRSYRSSPSKRLIGRRKGLEFYYGARACRPGNLAAFH